MYIDYHIIFLITWTVFEFAQLAIVNNNASSILFWSGSLGLLEHINTRQRTISPELSYIREKQIGHLESSKVSTFVVHPLLHHIPISSRPAQRLRAISVYAREHNGGTTHRRPDVFRKLRDRDRLMDVIKVIAEREIHKATLRTVSFTDSQGEHSLPHSVPPYSIAYLHTGLGCSTSLTK